MRYFHFYSNDNIMNPLVRCCFSSCYRDSRHVGDALCIAQIPLAADKDTVQELPLFSGLFFAAEKLPAETQISAVYMYYNTSAVEAGSTAAL